MFEYTVLSGSYSVVHEASFPIDSIVKYSRCDVTSITGPCAYLSLKEKVYGVATAAVNTLE